MLLVGVFGFLVLLVGVVLDCGARRVLLLVLLVGVAGGLDLVGRRSSFLLLVGYVQCLVLLVGALGDLVLLVGVLEFRFCWQALSGFD